MSEHEDTPPAGDPPAPARKRTARKKPAAPRKRATKKATTKAKASAAAEGAPDAGSVQASAAPAPAPAEPPPIPAALYRCPMAVRWRDLDAFNHVNNAQYLGYLEEARLQWMLGLPGMGLDDDVAPVIAAVQLNYRRPITWPAQVDIELFVERLGTTSVAIGHRILAADDAATVYCDGHVVMVWIDRASGQPTTLPVGVREACAA